MVPRGLSRAVRRRLEKRHHVSALAEECVQSLNALYSGEKVVASTLSGRPSLAQQSVLEHVLNSVKLLGPPPEGLTGPGALEQLRAFDGYGDDQTPAAIRPYSPQLLSLPTCGSEAVTLESLIGEEGGSIVDEFMRTRLLPESEARKVLKSSGLGQAYSDPQIEGTKYLCSICGKVDLC